jgi:hypothetical protein
LTHARSRRRPPAGRLSAQTRRPSTRREEGGVVLETGLDGSNPRVSAKYSRVRYHGGSCSPRVIAGGCVCWRWPMADRPYRYCWKSARARARRTESVVTQPRCSTRTLLALLQHAPTPKASACPCVTTAIAADSGVAAADR